MDCMPTCTSPITGTNVPTYQNQPTAKYRQRRANHSTAAETVSRAIAAKPTSQAGQGTFLT